MRNEKYIKIYANFLRKFLRPARPFKIIFDCSNGTAGPIINKLFTHHSSLIIHHLNNKPDGNFPAHGPDPLKTGATTQLRKEVKKRKADFGVIFDADADRVFFIDNRGRFVDPDIIGWLLIWQLKPRKAVIDVRTGWLVRKLITHNSLLIISKVGHYFIKKLMRKAKADLGIERSGHYYFKDFFYAESGILTAIHVINAVSRLPYALADFADLLPRYFRSGEINLRFKVKSLKGRNLFEKIEKKYKKQAIKVSHLDGLTIEAKHYWFNLRLSNTEPFIRINIEAEDGKILENTVEELTKLMTIYSL